MSPELEVATKSEIIAIYEQKREREWEKWKQQIAVYEEMLKAKDARIADLGAALIEERAKRLYIIRPDGLNYTNLATADGGQWWEEEAKKELRAEGLVSEEIE